MDYWFHWNEMVSAPSREQYVKWELLEIFLEYSRMFYHGFTLSWKLKSLDITLYGL